MRADDNQAVMSSTTSKGDARLADLRAIMADPLLNKVYSLEVGTKVSLTLAYVDYLGSYGHPMSDSYRATTSKKEVDIIASVVHVDVHTTENVTVSLDHAISFEASVSDDYRDSARIFDRKVPELSHMPMGTRLILRKTKGDCYGGSVYFLFRYDIEQIGTSLNSITLYPSFMDVAPAASAAAPSVSKVRKISELEKELEEHNAKRKKIQCEIDELRR